jgi:hypothetical protein
MSHKIYESEQLLLKETGILATNFFYEKWKERFCEHLQYCKTPIKSERCDKQSNRLLTV